MSSDPPFPEAREFANAMGFAVSEDWLSGFATARALAMVRADSAVPSSHPSALSDRAVLVDRCVPNAIAGLLTLYMEASDPPHDRKSREAWRRWKAWALKVADSMPEDGEDFIESIDKGIAACSAVCAEPAPTTASAPANSETDQQVLPVAQRPEASKVPCTSPADATVAPQERQVSNLRQSSDSSTDAACVLASAPGESILREALARPLPELPPGNCTIRLWQEGSQESDVTVWFDAKQMVDYAEAARSALAGIPPNASDDSSGALLGAVQRPRGTTER